VNVKVSIPLEEALAQKAVSEQVQAPLSQFTVTFVIFENTFPSESDTAAVAHALGYPYQHPKNATMVSPIEVGSMQLKEVWPVPLT